jgi:hypothetical protein
VVVYQEAVVAGSGNRFSIFLEKEIGHLLKSNNSRAINRVFSQNVLSDLLHIGNNEVFDYVVQRYANKPKNKTYGELLSEIYMHLCKEKRNEYYYKNTLLNKLLIGKHSINTATALSQIRIGKSIADFVVINGEGKIYVCEIKSDIDNFNRLENQLRDYYKVFSKVSVVVSKNEFEKVSNLLSQFSIIGNYVGIYALTERNTLSEQFKKEPKQLNKFLNYECIFKLLRKYEYENVLKSYFGTIPQVKPVFHFKACLEQFRKIPILRTQDLAFQELKKRNKIIKSEFDKIQNELKSVVYFSKLSQSLAILNQLLHTRYRSRS